MNVTKVYEKELEYTPAMQRADFRRLYCYKQGDTRVKGPYFAKPLSLCVRIGVSRATLVAWAHQDGVLEHSDPLADYLPARLDSMGGNAKGLQTNPYNAVSVFGKDVRDGKDRNAAALFDLNCLDWFAGGKA